MSSAPFTLDELVAHIHKLPAMPAVAMEVLASMAGADTDIDKLAHQIAQDQAIAARVLRVANSPFYGLQARVSSIHDAIVVLGLSSVRSLVLAAAVVTSLPAGCAAGFNQDRFWRHVLGTAVAAQALAQALGRRPESLFIAGLLHDIGRLALMVLDPDHFSRCLELAHSGDLPLTDAERRIFGFDHAQVGAALTARWNFPADIVDALAWHHDPQRGAPGGMAGIIHYADAISQALDLDEGKDEWSQVPRLDQETVTGLGLSWEVLLAVLEDTRNRFESYRLML
ncbi:HDOD domain-containing protein [Zoogloea sp.]|uniref:HDOD domain-containing protein n=1 Tax=Zoogloea sp. TaxID=49181 RepID=UPI0026328644|nr:HDOD domain-containing protein [Zoogloea sp.]MDD3353189.1 HDOD domain-containing protein [Zoogloea sp.]